MHKKVLFSLSRISLVMMSVVAISLGAQVYPSSTAYFTSVVSAVSNTIQVKADIEAPMAPLFWVEEDTTEVKVEWLASASEDVSGYKIYRSTDNLGYSLIASLGNVNTYTDTILNVNSEYYYKVTAVDSASNESSPVSIQGKYAGTKTFVIDDDGQAIDHNNTGTGVMGGTGSWQKYGTQAGVGVNVAADVLQNAVGGDDYSTAAAATGQTYTWQTNQQLPGQYDVYVQYICDPSRGVARYDVYANDTKLNSSPIEVYQSRSDGLSSSAPCSPQATSSVAGPTWVKLGSFLLQNKVGKVVLTAQAGESYIVADAVSFQHTGDNPNNGGGQQTNTPPVVKIESPAEGSSVSGTVQIRGSITDGDPAEYSLAAQQLDGANVVGFPGTVTMTTSISNQVLYTWDTTSVPNGQYILKLEARDAAGNKTPDPVVNDPENTSDSVDWITVTVTNTMALPPDPPMSSITVANSAARSIEERIQNGSFESGFTNWNVSGDVQLISGNDNFTLPQHGNKMVKIGKDVNEGNPARVNILSQQIPAGVRTMGFYYNMFTYDYQGFDDPGFMVFVNDKMVFQRWASEIDKDDPATGAQNLDSSGWQYFGIDVSKYPAGTTLTLAFYAGNDNLNLAGNDPHQTWVYVDNFSTNEAIVNAQSQFEIHTLPGDTAYYRIGTDPTVHQENTFSLSSAPANQTIYYWSANASGTEATNSFHVLYDNIAPETITDLTVAHQENNLFELTWSSPHDDNQFTSAGNDPSNAAGYEVRYSTTPIDASSDWSTLKNVEIVTEDGLPYGGYRAPRPESEQEQYFVRVTDSADHYYFAVRSYDAAMNWSSTSNIAELNLAEPAPINNTADIVLNEILPNPVGDDSGTKPSGEWIELYNKSTADIDVNGWAVYDANDAHELIISPANADNNLNPEDTGETVVPAHGYLVVYRNGDADFELDDSGDAVRLFTKPIGQVESAQIDSYTYSTAAAENKSFARIPDAIGAWVDPVPTPGRANVQSLDNLNPQAKIWQQESAKVKIALFDAVNYQHAQYTVEYTYKNGEEVLQGGLTGSIAIDEAREDVKDLYFGTCSTGGTCVPHTQVDPSSIVLKVVLTGDGIPDRTLTQHLTGSWTE